MSRELPSPPHHDSLRVVVVIEAWAAGGMETIAVSGAIGLREAGDAVLAVLPSGSKYDALAAQLEAAEVDCQRLDITPAHGRRAQAVGWWSLLRLLRRIRPTVVHIHCGGTYGGGLSYLAALAAGIPVVVTEHTPPAPALGVRSHLPRRPLELGTRFVVSVSQRNAALRAEQRGLVSRKRIAVVLNGIPSPPDEMIATWRRAERQARGYDISSVVIGCAAQMVPHKRIDDLLRACAMLEPGIAWRVLLVGDGRERPALEALAGTLGIADRVTFAGELPAARPAISAMDIFVLAQTEGSMSTAVLEAMDLGVVAVISHGGPGEAVIDHETGRWAPPGDAAGLSAVLESLARDPEERRRLAEAGQAHVRAGFSLARMTRDYVELYRAAAGRRPAPNRLRASAGVASRSTFRQPWEMKLRPDEGSSRREWFVSGVRWRMRRFNPRPQLQMRYPESASPPMPNLPANITLRTFESGDEDAWLELLTRNGELGEWDRARLEKENATMVPAGMIVACDGERLVATSGVHDRANRGQPAWEIGWVARDPEYARMGLGEAVTVASLRAALALEPREIYLKTDDHRLPAIKMYRKLGFVRVANTRRYRKRWRDVADAMAGASARAPD